MFSTKLTSVCTAGIFAAIGVCAANASDAAKSPIAQLTALSGDVLVDQGQSIAPAKAGTELAALDRVLVLEQGKATLAFADGCRDEITGPATRTITAEGPCLKGEAATDAQTLERAATSQDERFAAGAAAAAGSSGSAAAAGIGVAAVSAIVIGGSIINEATDGNDNKTSPTTFVASEERPTLSAQ